MRILGLDYGGRRIGVAICDELGMTAQGAATINRKNREADLDAIWDVTRGVLAIADSILDPAELAARLEYWHCPDIRSKTTVALNWLTGFQKGLDQNEQIS